MRTVDLSLCISYHVELVAPTIEVDGHQSTFNLSTVSQPPNSLGVLHIVPPTVRAGVIHIYRRVKYIKTMSKQPLELADKQICGGYSKGSLMGNWYEERLNKTREQPISKIV